MWRHREVNQPEKSAKMFSLIFEVRKIFANEDSRRKYDEALEKEGRPDGAADPSTAKKEEFQKYFNRIQEYYSDKQFDMAKLALEKALALEEYDPDENHVALHRCATVIYSDSNMFSQALEFANKALLANPDDLTNYEKKAMVLFAHLTERGNFDFFQQCHEILRATRDSWLKKAKRQNNAGEKQTRNMKPKLILCESRYEKNMRKSVRSFQNLDCFRAKKKRIAKPDK